MPIFAIRLFSLAFVAVGLTACGGTARYPNIDALAPAMKAEGLAYTDSRSLPAPKGRHLRIDEGRVLFSDAFWVEIMRIEDKKVFDIARRAAGILTIAEAYTERKFPGKPEIYTRAPYVIIVREEPEPGFVLSIVNALLPLQ